MSRFLSLVGHEFAMSVRRPGLWVAYTLLGAFYVVANLIPAASPADDIIQPDQVWPQAGHLVFMFNIFLPLLAGILAADRTPHDVSTGVRELQRSTPLRASEYILAKYAGVLLSVLLPMFLLVSVTGTLTVSRGLASAGFLWPLALAFLTIAVPSHAFVVAFSLAVPSVLPLRIYQVLFTGYWFWGNLLSPRAFPTISDTVLNAAGQYPLQAFFGVYVDSTHKVSEGFTPLQAVLNLAVLAACTAAALFCLGKYLHWQERRA
jgi:ABC-2 type transport system permease protein